MDYDKILAEEMIKAGNDSWIECNEKGNEVILTAMKEACKQILDEAAERADLWVESDINGTQFDGRRGVEIPHDGFTEKITVYKPSILQLKDEL